jgi:putative transposase
VVQVIGCSKGKSAMHVARSYPGKKKNFTGAHFRARGYHVSTVGWDEKMILAGIKAQEQEDRRIDKLTLLKQAEGCLLRGGPLNKRFEQFTRLKPPAFWVTYDFWRKNATHNQGFWQSAARLSISQRRIVVSDISRYCCQCLSDNLENRPRGRPRKMIGGCLEGPRCF